MLLRSGSFFIRVFEICLFKGVVLFVILVRYDKLKLLMEGCLVNKKIIGGIVGRWVIWKMEKGMVKCF